MCTLTRRSYSAKEDGVMLLELLQTAIWDILSSLLVSVGAPVVVREIELESLKSIGEGVQCLNAGFDDLGPDAIGGDGGDAVSLFGGGRHDVFSVSGLI